MSRSELAQSIDESTQGKVTHRQGEFNRKLGRDAALEWHINTLLTVCYARTEQARFRIKLFLGTPASSLRLRLNPITWIDCGPTGCARKVKQACKN